ncbi:hypothetical protein [Roseomonas genomospecies 6]|uniref:hypothetical protein n=1 Tax=Roseomonas genomospecies 6 TaxID=214106 RepID=UPI0025710B37|nr:hypothetical protein [Roseomonas genomospecies 6]
MAEDRVYNVLFLCTHNSDPSSAQGTDAEKAAFTADVFRQIERRLQAFMGLPIAALDRLALKQRLDEMGRGTGGQA